MVDNTVSTQSTPSIDNFAPILIVAISMILAHYFNDSDRHRSLCEEIRARYLIPDKGPLFYKDDKPELLDEIKLNDDFLKARLILIHFGVISIVTIFGLALTGCIIYYSTKYFIYKSTTNKSYLYWAYFLYAILSFIIVITITYLAQQCVTARRLDELLKKKLRGNGSYFDQGYKMLEGKVDRPRFLHYWLSKGSIFIFISLYRLYDGLFKLPGKLFRCVKINLSRIFSG